ncbi:type II and III secretion system protein family protein [Alteromonas sp. ASW11-19]|uniref:Type II and III secretion system protein family protein n=1 Tax=Alteromonas salexigens TaxID=2982530 RepID=A0ABT2VNI7_9ALTE|nr:type II and III secretion system protein family protein [Alteromonas salexigens]MCU7554875.1 type II and III secretion system protein family protein [Alteromonas salexigens]
MKLLQMINRGAICVTLVLAVWMLIIMQPAHAGGPVTDKHSAIHVPIYKSRNLHLKRGAQRVSVGNPEIADILILRQKELYIVGKKLGTTNVMVWDEDDALVDVINIEITHDLVSLRERLHRFLPEENINVHTSQGQLVLSGETSSLMQMNKAVDLAHAYAVAAGEDDNSQVLNLLSVGGGHQVMLEVVVAEMSTEVSRSFNVDLNLLSMLDDNHWDASLIRGAEFYNFVTQGSPYEFSNGVIGEYIDGNVFFNVALDIAKENGMAKILAEPNLTALSGQKAEFLSGGEFPIPVPREDGIAIQFREFGVGVGFVPTVLDSGKINLNLKVLVSEISNANTVGITPTGTNSSLIIPSIIKRTSETTVELGDGQTLAIGGLLSDNLRENIERFPGLGDIPILGQLFRSQQFVSGQSELVIMVTPRLVRPFNKAGVSLPTDGFVPVSDLKFYLMGEPTQQVTHHSESRSYNVESPYDILPSNGGTDSRYGHDIEQHGGTY